METRDSDFVDGPLDNSCNKEYYLYIGIWYRTVSSGNFNQTTHAHIINVYAGGYITDAWADHKSGVLYSIFINLELCYIIAIIEAGFLGRILVKINFTISIRIFILGYLHLMNLFQLRRHE